MLINNTYTDRKDIYYNVVLYAKYKYNTNKC